MCYRLVISLSAVLVATAGCHSEPPAASPADDLSVTSKSSLSQPTGASPTAIAPANGKPTTYDKEETQIIVNRGSRSSQECAKLHPEGPMGQVTVHLTLSGTGKIADASLPPPFDDTPIGKCVKRAFENSIIPPWQGPDVNLDAEVTLKADKEKKK